MFPNKCYDRITFKVGPSKLYKNNNSVQKTDKMETFMRKQKTIISYAKINDTEFADLVQHIITRMTKNTDFPTPSPTLAVIQASYKAFIDALAKAKEGSKQDTANKNEKRSELEVNLSNLGNYVNAVANGNIVKLDGSGFPISKLPENIGILPAPDYIHVTDGDNHGELNVEICPVAKALSYTVLYAESPAPENDMDWYNKTFSKSKGTIVGLARGKKYIVKVAATSSEANKLGYYNFSQPVERITQ